MVQNPRVLSHGLSWIQYMAQHPPAMKMKVWPGGLRASLEQKKEKALVMEKDKEMMSLVLKGMIELT